MEKTIQLTEDDLLTLQRCLNEGMEPPQELAKRLFPSLYASFDFKTLKDSKIPTIEYQGKQDWCQILNCELLPEFCIKLDANAPISCESL